MIWQDSPGDNALGEDFKNMQGARRLLVGSTDDGRARQGEPSADGRVLLTAVRVWGRAVGVDLPWPRGGARRWKG